MVFKQILSRGLQPHREEAPAERPGPDATVPGRCQQDTPGEAPPLLMKICGSRFQYPIPAWIFSVVNVPWF